ncbi:MAG: FecR family protein, partial [Chloroflexota bacterium]
MSTPDLASVIDQCLDDLVTGRATMSECLERYPEHRAELEPLLLAAASLQAVPSRAERAPNRIRRAQFMELIRETPQERRSWLPSLAGLLTTGLFPRVLAATAPVALAVGIGMFLLVSQPATPAAASTLTVFAGGAEEQVGGEWRALSDGAAVRQGARVRTTAEGHALLTFPDGSTSSLEPSTEIAIELLAAGTPRQVQIRQFSGRLWNDVVTDTREGARYEVLTSDATVQVHGTVFETAVDNGQTSVTTSEGLVDVVVGTERVSVPGGQLVRAQGQRVSERGAAQAAGSLTINAPFAAALVSDRGEATGARTDGAIFRQIRGVTTSNPGDGPQRFEFQRLPPGDYTLLLQRFEQGSGDLVLNVNGVERRVPIDESSGTTQLRVHVDLQDGKPRVALSGDRPRPAPAAERPPVVRVVETERTKKLPDVATQRAAVTRREAPTTTGPVAAAPAAGSSRTPGAVAATSAQGTPDPQIQRLRDAI